MRLLRFVRWLWTLLHPFSWVVMAVVSAALVLIVVPGEGVGFSELEITESSVWAHDGLLSDYPSRYTEIHLHGWPYTGVARAVAYDQWPSPTFTSGNPPPPPTPPKSYWTEARSWPLAADKWLVSWPTVALDVIIIVALVLGVGALSELWLRRRGGLFRLRIVDFLAMFTVVALLVAWHQYHVRLQRTEQQVATYFENCRHGSLNQMNGSMLRWETFDVHKEYCGPEWLRRLVGNEAFLPTFHHVRSAHLRVAESWRDDVDQLARLPYIHEVCITGVLPRGMVEKLARFPRLESLELQVYIHYVTSGGLLDWELIPASDLVQPWELDVLGVLSLQELNLHAGAILAEDVERICRAMPDLQTLFLQDLPVTNNEVDELRSMYPKLHLSGDWNRRSPEVEQLREEVIRRRAEMNEQPEVQSAE